MNHISEDELIYHKVEGNIYSGGFKIHSLLNHSLHEKEQTGGGSSSLAIPLGLYSTENIQSPHLKKIYTSSEYLVENPNSSKNKTKKKY